MAIITTTRTDDARRAAERRRVRLKGAEAPQGSLTSRTSHRGSKPSVMLAVRHGSAPTTGPGRLALARDNTMTVNPTTGDLTSICTDRAYTFNANGNRTQLATTTRPGGDCATTGTTTTVTTAGWDSADRPTSGRNGAGVYVYDLFGRQTTLPSSDAPNHAGGNITLGYFDDDLPRVVIQGGTSSTFTLDANGRRATQTGSSDLSVGS